MAPPLSAPRLATALGAGLLVTFFVLVPDYRVLAMVLGVAGWRVRSGARFESVFLALFSGIFVLAAWKTAAASSLGGALVITMFSVALIHWVQLDPNKSAQENWGTTWREFSRCFGPPWSRGTISGRWFILGLWLSLLPIANTPPEKIPQHLVMWSVVFLPTWVALRIRPRWDPALLIRISLFTSGAHLLWRDTVGVLPRLGRHGMLPFSAMTLALVWFLHERLTVARVYANAHPRWVLDDESKEHRAIRLTSNSAHAYRSQARGEVVGWLPNHAGSLRGKPVRTLLSAVVFALYAFVFMLLFD